MLRIGIDARPLLLPQSGIPRVLRSLVGELVRIDQENSYYLYSPRDFDLPLENPRWHKRIGGRFSRLSGTIWFQTEVRRAVLDDQFDVFWGTSHFLPLSLPSKVSKVLTVHDLVWRLHPRTMTLKSYCVHRLLSERSVRQADRVIADSQSTARDLQRVLEVPESKIEVIHPGVGPAYKPHDPRAAAEYVASKYGVTKDYAMTVGTVEPRKNLITLVEAMRILRDRGESSLQLLVVGERGWKNAELYKSVQRFGLAGNDIRFLGFVPEEDLPMLYAGACLFVFPSLYEGFGLPLVEAMACGTPIIASNASSIPEVVQDAAILVSPHQAGDFAEAMLRVMGDADLRRTTVQRGLRRACDFRWDRAASRVLACMERVATQRLSGTTEGQKPMIRDPH
jgi:glycosyltransferase involved in cell wall biosynthesis